MDSECVFAEGGGVLVGSMCKMLVGVWIEDRSF